MRTRSERPSQQLTANSERLTDTCKCSSNEESHACTIRTCFGCPNQLKPKPSFQFSANLHLVFQFFTVRKRSCRKVIFLHLFVILFTRGRCTPPGRYHPWQTPPPPARIPRQTSPPPDTPWQTPPKRRQLQRSVRILLECILVHTNIFFLTNLTASRNSVLLSV